MSLWNYVRSARSIADELFDLLTKEDYKQLAALLRDPAGAWQDVRPAELDEAIRFLSAEPAQRLRQWEKLPVDHRRLLWLRARQLGLLSANAIALAERVEGVVGMKYRAAVREVARSALQLDLHPTLAALLDRSAE